MKSDMKRKKMFAMGLILSLIIFFTINAVSYWNTKRHIESRVNVEKTLTILYELENLISRIKDAENGQHGFIITGSWISLEPYYDGITAVHKSMKAIKELTPIDDQAYQKLDIIQGLIEKRFGELHKTITLRKKRGIEAAIKSFMTSQDEKVMADIRNLVKELKHEKTNLLQALNRISEVSSHRTLLTILTGNLVALLFVIFSLYQLSRDIAERKQAEETLRESEETFSGFFNQGNIGMAITSLEKGWLNVNKKLCNMLGYSKDELMRMTWTEMTNPDDLEKDLVQFEKIVSGEIEHYEMEKRFTRKDKNIIYTYLTVSCIRYADGSVDKVLATLQDITERKIGEEKLRENEEEIRELNLVLEKRIRDRTKELETANKELESFAYSVSHDLRAPLRSMDGFSVALLEEYADKLDDQGKDYLQRVRDASKRMAQLIEGILDLSRTTRGEMSREAVNLSDLAKTITADLKKLQPERRVEFIIEPELVVNGDMRLLRAAIENLLGNAWKFTGRCDQGKIEFGVLPSSEAEESGKPGNHTYFVRDNGAGFDMTYADKLFGVFQRLHRANEFPGTGIGLATVERIIHRHGGRVWAEARVDEGATFYFSLPRGV